MHFGTNLQYLRRHGNMTQERLADQLRVTRQTISKWESGEALPDVNKLLELCDIFSCSLDTLLREDMCCHSSVYLPVRLERVKGFRYASYVVISRHPESDAQSCVTAWADQCGLLPWNPTFLGWDFPYISQDQKHRFGLHGYVSAVILPDGFSTDVPGLDIAGQEDATYAVMTIRDPFCAPFERIPRAYGLILEYLSANGIKKKHKQDILPCFERVYENDGVTCMDIYIHCQEVSSSIFTNFT